MPSAWMNPFAQFLNAAHSAFRKIPQQPEVHTDADLLPKFVEKYEHRRFVFDIVDRVETLAASFDRLRVLYESYTDNQSKMDLIVAEQRAGDPARVRFEIPDQLVRERDQYTVEARAHVAFIYYEMSTVVALLSKLLKPQPSSNLEYLVGVRNKILAHPRRNAGTKSSSSALTVGPILHAHLVGGESWFPLLRNWYLQKLRDAGGWLDDADGIAANMALLRSDVTVERFTLINRLRLKSFVIREPDPLGSAGEMATMLMAKFLPDIKGACRPVLRKPRVSKSARVS
jgi:hypothetical protein